MDKHKYDGSGNTRPVPNDSIRMPASKSRNAIAPLLRLGGTIKLPGDAPFAQVYISIRLLWHI